MTPSSVSYLLGCLSIFFAERIFATSDEIRWPLLALGVVLVLVALGSTASALGRHNVPARTTLAFYLLSMSSALFYLAADTVWMTESGIAVSDARQYVVALQAAVPLLWFIGVLPAINLERTMANHPKSIHPLRVRAAVEGGLAIGLGLGMLFPINYLAAAHNKKFDYGFFKTTAVGSATLQVAENLPEPVRVVLFFPDSSDVLKEVKPYFDNLEGASITVEVLDQVMVPDQAKELKVRENGTIAIARGKSIETVKLGDNLDKARKDLRKLDSKVHAALLKLARDRKTVYFTVGHDEMFWKNAPTDEEKIDVAKKVLEGLNLQVKELGFDDGLGHSIPDNAAAVFIVAPRAPFLPAERQALANYRDSGGALFLMLEPGGEPDPELAAMFGVSFDGVNWLSDKERTYMQVTGGLTDRAYVGTNKYTTHESVTTLSKNSTQAILVTPGVGAIKELEGAAGKYAATVKGMPDWWADLDGDYAMDKGDESRGQPDIGAAISGPATGGLEWRAAVVGDATWFSNLFLQRPANAVYLAETVGWLTQDKTLGGETESEEDVRIQHTKEGQKYWFYGAIAGVPLLVMGFGVWVARSRRKS